MRKTEVERLNSFFSKDSFNETELKIKERALALEEKLIERKRGLEEVSAEHNRLQQEVNLLAQQLNGIFQVVLDLVPEQDSAESVENEDEV